MKREINLYLLGGFVFTSLVGTLFHFAYEWSGNNIIVAAVSAVNESTAEHLKIFFFPTFIFGIFEYLKYGKEIGCFWKIKLEGILLGMLFITAFFYTYKGIVGHNIDFLNILDFFLGAAVCYIWQKLRFRNNRKNCREFVWFGITCLIAAAFIYFTYNPPVIGLFEDPITLEYGIVH